jgi:hypothetical protein
MKKYGEYMKNSILLIILMAILTTTVSAIEIEINRCNNAYVTGETPTLARFGQDYLQTLNPKIFETKEGRDLVIEINMQAGKHKLFICAKPGIWQDTIYDLSKKYKADIKFKR